MDEFSLIETYFACQADDSESCQPESQSVVHGIGDDCAVLNVPEGEQLVVSTDTLVENVHFLPESPPEMLAWRLLGSSVSDLAAMGGTPLGFTLAITLPDAPDAWLKPFSYGLHQAASFYHIPLIGGDTTKGPLTLTATVHGSVPRGQALLRNGAQPGDLVCVSGTLGDSRAGLELLLSGKQQSHDSLESFLLQRFYKPKAQIQTGCLLRRRATSCIDLSDGLSSDLRHLLKASDCGAQLDLSALPLSQALQTLYPDKAQEWALHGGEDFELCFTHPEDSIKETLSLVNDLGVRLSVIGEIIVEQGLFVEKNGRRSFLDAAGYNHFGSRKN